MPVTGAIFTTNVGCTGVNINIFGSKDDVYLDGGPSHPGAAGLPDGSYYVQVTEPNGAQLGFSPTAAVTVSGGEFISCYQLSAILVKTSDNSPGYDSTSNAGGEYKVWVSMNSTFPSNESKTDNFKVREEGGTPPQGTLVVVKFYDANANGILDPTDTPITGWQVNIRDGFDIIRSTPVNIVVAEDTYTVTECSPDALNWRNTTSTSQVVVVNDGDTVTVAFGNVCLGAGGGLTLGFWSNKNGGKVITGPPNLLPGVLALCLRKANGGLLGAVNLGNFQKFLTDANASNMANMLSAQLAAMHLNVASGGVNGNAIIYAPGTNSANAFGFATVNAVMNEANTLLCAGGAPTLILLSGNPLRPRAEALKNALDNANNNRNFVQATPCDTPLTFTCPTAP
ncbi:MAG TPA: hypothetical protein VKA70_19490 [Blastocatellia bacterium]|nr:hypothetical protein [Blastocatellia bacterium]